MVVYGLSAESRSSAGWFAAVDAGGLRGSRDEDDAELQQAGVEMGSYENDGDVEQQENSKGG